MVVLALAQCWGRRGGQQEVGGWWKGGHGRGGWRMRVLGCLLQDKVEKKGFR